GLPRARPRATPPPSCLRTREGLPAPVGCHADRVLPSVPAEYLYRKTDRTDVRLDICDGQGDAYEKTAGARYRLFAPSNSSSASWIWRRSTTNWGKVSRDSRPR